MRMLMANGSPNLNGSDCCSERRGGLRWAVQTGVWLEKLEAKDRKEPRRHVLSCSEMPWGFGSR